MAKLTAIMRTSNDMYFFVAPDGTLLDFSASGPDRTFIPPEQFLGKRVDEVMPPHVSKLTREHLAIVAETGGASQFEYSLDEADGEHHYECRIAPLSPGTLLAFIRDVTRLHAALRAVAESDARFENLFQTAAEGVWVIDRDGNTTMVNEAAAAMLGYSPAEMMGRHMNEFMDPSEHSTAAENMKKRMNGVREHHDFRLRRRDGSELWTIMATSPILDADGEFVGALAMMTDITERKRYEEERQRLLQESQAAVSARDEFLSIASHELRTPVTSLQLAIQALLRAANKAPDRPIESLRPLLNAADAQTHKLSRQIDLLFDVSRIAAGQLALYKTQVDLHEVVTAVVASFAEEVERTGSTLSVHCDAPLIGEWDRDRMEQLLTNLIGNALKYGAGKPIEVWGQRDAERAVIIVRDQGIGIAKEQQSTVFHRFERAVEAAQYRGMGLGLFIVQQIVTTHGGTIELESELGAGSTFTVTLPLG